MIDRVIGRRRRTTDRRRVRFPTIGHVDVGPDGDAAVVGGAENVASWRFPYVDIVVLGIVTLAAYGTWAYSFGVLLDPLLDDTGWSESVVTGAFAISSALGGVIAFPAGRFLDAVGARVVFAVAAIASTAFLVSASYATDARVFVATAVAGGAALAGLAFYHVTQTVAVRAAPREGTRAIALLTIIGAFSSAIYLPLAAVLVEAFGWRMALRSMAVAAGIVLVAAAVFVRERTEVVQRGRTASAPISLRRPEVVRFLTASALAGVAIGIILVYQVPLMVGAGLPLATAATVAGLRGALQIVGRLPMTSMLARWDARTVTRLAFASVAVGVVLLGFAGNLVVAGLFALVAGFGIGAWSPLQGIYADELFDRSRLGAAMGTVSMVSGLAVAAGPAVAGVLSDLTGTRAWGVVIGAMSASASVVLLRLPPQERSAAGADQSGAS